MTRDDDDNRDTPPMRLAVEYRPVPGFPQHRIGSDRSVWLEETRPALPPPWNRPRWRPVRTFKIQGRAHVRLREGGRERVRSVDLLHTAAFSAEPSAWAARIQMTFHRACRADAIPADPPPIAAGQAEPCPVAEAPTPPPPADVPGVVYRDVPGFEGYRVGDDRSVWSRYVNTGNGRALSDPPSWTRKVAWGRGNHAPRVILWRGGRPFHRAPETLYRLAFAPPPRPLPEPLPLGGHLGEPARGEANGSARLDESKVAEARRLKRAGWTYPELAERYGVSKSTLFYAISGRTWSHVGEGQPS